MGKIEETLGRSDLYKIDPRLIHIEEGWNPRLNWGDMEGLKLSIISEGVKDPLKVKVRPEGGFILLDGERRLRATMTAIAEGAEIRSVPCIVKPKNYTAADALLDTLSNGIHGEPFDALSEAEVYRRFTVWGWTQEQISKRVGKSVATVNQKLSLLNAVPVLQEALKSGEITPSLALSIIQKDKKEKKKAKNDPDNKVAENFQEEAVAQVKAGKKNEVTKSVKRPNNKQFKVLSDMVDTYFKDPKQVVKSFEEFHKPRTTGLNVSETNEAIEEAYYLGRITMQAEVLGYTVEDLPSLLKKEE